jgi:hypothetical protein
MYVSISDGSLRVAPGVTVSAVTAVLSRHPPTQERHLDIIVNDGIAPATLMCPLHGAVSSTLSTSPDPKWRISPSVVVIDMVP